MATLRDDGKRETSQLLGDDISVFVQATVKCSVMIFTGFNWILSARDYFHL